MKAVRCVSAVVACMSLAAGVAWSQSYPTKPVRVIVPFPPAGANDIVGRIVLPKMAEQLGQQFIIDNRPGAGGTIGSAVVAKSPPDGYTLLIQTAASHVSNAHLYSKLAYDPLKDFVGITPLGKLGAVLTVHPSMPTHTLKEFIALAKQKPGAILHGHSGYGSFTHFNGVLFESRTGIRMTHVPFKGGGPAVVALVSGETQAQVAAIGELIAHIQSGRVRALAVTTLERIPLLPDVPPMADTFPGYESWTWVTAFASAGMPKPLLDRLNAEFGKALADPGVASNLRTQTLEPAHKTPEELAQKLKADSEMIGALFRKYNVKLD